MPTYHYKCKNCEDEFEIIQSMSDDSLTECTKCNQPTLAKVIHAGNFILKGQGWEIAPHEKFDYKDGKKRSKESYAKSHAYAQEELQS